jgi:hypothetical protein
MSALAWLQDTGFSTWLRESDWALFAALILHTIGMGFLVGTAGVIAIQRSSWLSFIPTVSLQRVSPIVHVALWIAILSGVLLVVSYPAKALTNPLFYLKLVLLAGAWQVTRSGFRVSQSARVAAIGVVAWIAVLVLGKFLAYTHTELLVY